MIGGRQNGTSYEDFISGPPSTKLPEVNQNAVAAIFQSSGTTSPSKPIDLTHSNIVAGLETVDERLKLNSADSVLAVAPFFHVMGFYAMLLTSLRRGSTIVTLDTPVIDKIFDLMKEGQRFTYQQLCDRWGYLGKPETLREM